MCPPRRFQLWVVMVVVALCAAATFGAPVFAQSSAQSTAAVGEWRHFGSVAANTKYSPLDLIGPENFTDLEIAWRWTSIETDVIRERQDIRPGPFKSVSLMIEGVVYLSTSLGQVAALDAGHRRACLVV